MSAGDVPTEQVTEPTLDAVVALVRSAQPRSSESADTQVVAAALLAGASRHRRRVVARWSVGAVALAAAAALGLVLRPAPRAHEPTRVTLASGDVLTAVAGARFTVEPTAAGTRHVRLDQGAMLFDIRPLGPGEHFEVRTRDARVRVVGTVFAVEAAPRGTSVRVYEGHVEVDDRDGARSLFRGDSLAVDRSVGGLAELAQAGRAAAEARRAHEASVAALATAPTAGRAERAPREPTAEAPRGGTAQELGERGSEEERRGADPDPDAVRARIADGHAAIALRLAHGRSGAEWRFVEADALRALRRFPEAATMYDTAARGLDADGRAQAAYLAAVVHLDEGGDAAAALASLDAAAVDAPGAPLRERALALRARALDVLHRDAALRDVARAYLDAYPQGSRAEWMRRHVAN